MRVLVVEDDARLASVVERGLASFGFSVDTRGDGLAGFDAASSGHYDVIVLDIMLPGRNGYKVVADLRRVGVWTPVLMLTAKDGEWDEAEAFEAGADDYLRKPFSFPVLSARLHALIRRGSPKRPRVLQVGSLSLDPTARVVRRGKEPINLTTREFDLLEQLVLAAQDPVPKLDLLSHVWGPDFEGGTNVLEVYIGYLRQKIDQPFGLTTLHTVRGFGYRLAAEDVKGSS
jgi:two-component system OmpR family response regulator